MSSIKSEVSELRRALNYRCIIFIALGAAMGSVFFSASSEAIDKVGPIVLLAYLFVGCAVFMVIRAFANMLMYKTILGSFTTVAILMFFIIETAYHADNRVALYACIIWPVLLTVNYLFWVKKRN